MQRLVYRYSIHACHHRSRGRIQRQRARDLSHTHFHSIPRARQTDEALCDHYMWRENIAIFVVICVIGFAIILLNNSDCTAMKWCTL
jgi:hypothetical protein